MFFSDVVETKGYEPLAPKLDDNVETVDVATCFELAILRVDVVTDTDDLVNQVDQAYCTDGLILQVDATNYIIELISTREVSISTEVKPEQQTEFKRRASTMQEQNRVKRDQKTQPTRDVQRKRTLVLPTELELIEIDRVY